tara:strand:+ start:5102 stop:5773 length:672 start_codon:yes stop_codon:yes gene_type:complete
LSVFLSNLSVTSWLILANVVFFVVAMIFLLIYGEQVFNYIALRPVDIIQGKYLWTFLTSMFMHAGFLHLFINMFVLFSLGSFCEKIIGRKRFFWFYIISGLVAGGLFVLLAGLYGEGEFGARVFGSVLIPAVGASGAIFAIAGLFMILLPKLKFSIIFLPFFSLPAYIMIPLVLFLTWGVSAGTGLPLGNTAHFGGFMAGVIYGLYLRKKYSRKVARLNRMIH